MIYYKILNKSAGIRIFLVLYILICEIEIRPPHNKLCVQRLCYWPETSEYIKIHG